MVEPSLGQTLAFTAEQVSALGRTTAELVKARSKRAGGNLGAGIAAFAVALTLLLGLIPLLVLALVAWLVAMGIAPAVAYLMAAGAALLVAAALALIGRALLRHATRSLKDAATIIKDSLRALRGASAEAPPEASPHPETDPR
ncbi:MAG: phage holin family protein [Bifidobacteriaceae bacterium]|jgi:protein-S-isoprenylcysteine O-methyltransferase Ste14|nr:phage holin family protein [Bifidobacteriaceae bacterium]